MIGSPFPWRVEGQDIYDANNNIVARAVNSVVAKYIVDCHGSVARAAAALGVKGGSVLSEPKAEAARENGKLGGRPSKS